MRSRKDDVNHGVLKALGAEAWPGRETRNGKGGASVEERERGERSGRSSRVRNGRLKGKELHKNTCRNKYQTHRCAIEGQISVVSSIQIWERQIF